MAKSNKEKVRPPMFDRRVHVRQKIVRFFFHLFGWTGLAVLFYIAFSIFFDTPVEIRMKYGTAEMRRQYEILDARYDSLDMVLDNVVQRDRNVFKVLFEAEPYALDDFGAARLATYEQLLQKSTDDISAELNRKTLALEKKMAFLNTSYEKLAEKAAASGENLDYIPAIQPVINKELTLLTASYGLRIHPFYKTLVAHNGVDYTVPEGSRVFATADGRVKDVIRNNSSSGLTVIVSHGANYETQYSHLSRVNVKRGEQVKRGDIIALTGNTGLSLAPHLHYEVRHNSMRVDPIHYFFMELTPLDYRRIQQIALSGMQSFD